MRTRQHAIVFLLALSACATPAGGSSEADGSAPTVRHGALDPITGAELEDPQVAAGSALDAIRRLRPSYLNLRGGGGLDPTTNAVLVSVDGSGLSSLSTLSSILAAQVGEIRYLSATDAAQRFGTRGIAGPVILVTTRRR
ncbi:MAG TPA: hypothetical protein VGG84_16750 [Gemmatimonadaceae bacterium]|jgi:hypothetical protein